MTTPGLWFLFITWALFVSNLWLPRNWGFYGPLDWDLTYSNLETARKSIMEFGQWPSFNPWSAFGTDFNSNPQSSHAGIFFLPVLIFGSFYGYKVSIILAMVLGLWGAYRCFLLLNENKPIAIYGAMLFCGCNYFGAHIFQAGHSNTLYLYFLPWIIYYLIRLREKRNSLGWIMPVILLSQMITGGAPISFIIAAILILAWALFTVWNEKNFRFLLTVCRIGALAIIASFWKIWPEIHYWQHSPRLIKDDSFVGPITWLQMLAGFEVDPRVWHGWWELNLGFNLILIGIVLYYRRSIPSFFRWLILAFCVMWLCLGNIPPYINPWHLLNNYVPIFTSLRAPYRFGIILIFAFTLALVFVVKNQKEIGLVSFLLLVASVAQSLSFNAISSNCFKGKLIEDIQQPPATIAKPIKLDSAQAKTQYLFIKQNYLVANAYEPLKLSAVNDTPNTFVSGASLLHFTPNHLRLKITDSQACLSLRYSSNWHIKGNGILTSRRGLLCITGGSGNIDLYYTNPDVKTGLLVSLLAFPLGLLFLFWQKKS